MCYSFSRTLVERSPWWQMDLGGSNFVSNLTIWNVEGVESNTLSNFYVLLSEQPFLSTVLQVINVFQGGALSMQSSYAQGCRSC